jgi:hypothetical protein
MRSARGGTADPGTPVPARDSGYVYSSALATDCRRIAGRTTADTGSIGVDETTRSIAHHGDGPMRTMRARAHSEASTRVREARAAHCCPEKNFPTSALIAPITPPSSPDRVVHRASQRDRAHVDDSAAHLVRVRCDPRRATRSTRCTNTGRDENAMRMNLDADAGQGAQ